MQTADMLNLPVPKAEYINEVLKPSETQEEMVSSFADRAEAVRNGNVNPRFDNMLKITNDGRKLALDQRLMNEMLPDEPESKVNRCVDNAFEVWEESAPDKGTQLIFAIYRHQKPMVHSTSTMMCGRNWWREVFPVKKWRSFTSTTPKRKKQTCLQRCALDRCVF